MTNFKTNFIGLLILGLMCSSFLHKEKEKSSDTKIFTLNANEEFIFGEFTFEKSKIKVFNSSSEQLQLKILDEESLEPQTIISLESQTSFTALLFPWEKIIIQNPNDTDVNVEVKSSKLISGFRIQEMQIHTE